MGKSAVPHPESLLGRARVAATVVGLSGLKKEKPATGKVVEITADGRQGQFRWETGDFTAQISGDDKEAVYVAADGVPVGQGAWVRVDKKRLKVSAFGADKTGNEDSKAALEAAIESGLPLDFESGNFVVSGQIGDISKELQGVDWELGNSTITMMGGDHVEAVVAYGLAPGANVKIGGGRIVINGSSKANTGIYFRQNSDDRSGIFYAEGVEVKNLRRVVEFNTSDGIRVSGGFKRVVLREPSVQEMVLPVGAGSVGVVGVHGITISRSSADGAYVEESEIYSPFVRNIYSEDANYQDDMDGMRLFADVDGVGRGDTKHWVVGGEFVNCWGRDIKIQAPRAEVQGVKIRHDSGPASGMDQPLIDFQNGGGVVYGLQCELDGQEPPAIVNFGSTGAGVEVTSALRDSFIKVENAELPCVVRGFSTNELLGQIGLENVNLKGAVTNVVVLRTPNDKAIATLKDVQCDNITDALAKVLSQGGAPPYKASFTFIKCVNTGQSVPLARGRVPGNAANFEISEFDCFGFDRGSGRVNPTDETRSGLTKVSSIVGPYEKGGSARMDAVELADGESKVFPAIGYSPGVQMALVSMSRTANEQGVVAFDSAGVDVLAGGSGVVAGGNADPGSGNIRLWVDSVSGGLVVANQSGATRVVTLLFFG